MTKQSDVALDTGPASEEAELKRLGIVRIPADTFEWSGFRYSQARDAIAAAKRSPSQ